MDTIQFQTLGLTNNFGTESVILTCPGDKDVSKIEVKVKKYLPVGDKIQIISKVVQNSMVSGIARLDLIKVNLDLELIQAYTNIEFSENELQNSLETYDKLEYAGIFYDIVSSIEQSEKDFIQEGVEDYKTQLEKSIASSMSGYVTQIDSMKALVGNYIKENAE